MHCCRSSHFAVTKVTRWVPGSCSWPPCDAAETVLACSGGPWVKRVSAQAAQANGGAGCRGHSPPLSGTEKAKSFVAGRDEGHAATLVGGERPSPRAPFSIARRACP
jgi:hypothetical protein